MFFYKNSSNKVWFASNKRYAMKRLVILVVTAALIGGCGSYNTGELVGVEGRKVMRKRFRDDILTLTLPWPLFLRMEQEADDCIFQIPSWKKFNRH